ncbi:MAG TPA: protein kinase [Candidatus Acidoferrum sp.]|nr:protein kinase [Candidatus Acidoferrum sp.]
MKICPQCQRSYPTSFAVCPQDGAKLVEPLDWPEGMVIRGKYKILGKIGEGGMGAVYKAMHMHFNEACALKVMSPSLMNDTALVKRFGREAIIARKLRHKNAVKVEDFDETEDGRPFIVMEYIEGQSLKDLMNAQGPLQVSRTCSIIRQAAAALDAAHQICLIHRDIKPDNIVLVVSDGEEVAKVLDFGIAKIRDSQSTSSGMALTATGMVIGTPPYMSPEQAKGTEGESIDGRSDIYSLGVVMYQMLTGVLPLKADTPLNMLIAQIQTPPTPIFQARPGVRIPAALGSLTMKCLEKDRALRPQTGRELIEALDLCERADAQARAGSLQRSVKDFSESTTVPDTPVSWAGAASPSSATSYAGNATAPAPSQDASLFGAQSNSPTMPTSASPAASASASASVHTPAAGKSRTLLFFVGALGVVVVVALGGYFLRAKSAVAPHSNPAATELSGPTPVAPRSAPPPAANNSTAPKESATQESTPKRGEPSRREDDAQKAKRQSQKTAEATVRESEAQLAERAKAAAAATSLGDLYFQNGEYDNAIHEYQTGLDADPGNKTLQDKLASAKKSKAASPSPNL